MTEIELVLAIMRLVSNLYKLEESLASREDYCYYSSSFSEIGDQVKFALKQSITLEDYLIVAI